MSSKTKFSMKGLKFNPIGDIFITFKATNDIFSVSWAETSVHNYIIGTMYVWNSGEMLCKNLNTGEIAKLYLKPKGWTTSSDYESKGECLNSNGQKTYTLFGKWNSFLEAKDHKNNSTFKIISFHEKPLNYKEQYHFSKWMINSNNLSSKIVHWLPPTDCWFWPDTRAYEYGDMWLA